MTKNYFNIPVDDEETYIAVKLIAENNGFGKRGMGQQIKAWVSQTLAAPVCDHPKTLVQVQRNYSATVLTSVIAGEKHLFYQAYYCATCNRVYQQASAPNAEPVSAEAIAAAKVDPYGQPAPAVVTKRKRVQRNERVN